MKIFMILLILIGGLAGGSSHKQCVYVDSKSTFISDLQRSGLKVDFKNQTWYVQQKVVAHAPAEDEPFNLCW